MKKYFALSELRVSVVKVKPDINRGGAERASIGCAAIKNPPHGEPVEPYELCVSAVNKERR